MSDFEAWAKSERFDVSKDASGQYLWPSTRNLHRAFEAGVVSGRQRCLDGLGIPARAYHDAYWAEFEKWVADDRTHWIGPKDAAWQAWMHLHDEKIAELLAENERLIEALKAQLEANVSVSDHAVAETCRAIRAEARLRELASAEPLAYGFPNTAIAGSGPAMMMLRHEPPPNDQYAGQLWIPLILRPEMPR